MPLDPAIKQMLDWLEELGRHRISEGTPEQGRAAFRTLTVDMRQPQNVIPVADVEDMELPGETGPMRARLYRPEADGPLPTIVFFHGGGFVIGDLDTHDNQCRMVCRDVEAVVLSIDYRLAPEDPWPAGVEDCEAATRWAAEHIDELGGDPDLLALAGDSAGGNLAAVVAQICRDAGEPKIAVQLLIYPGVDFREGTEERYPSYVENAEGYFLEAADTEWFRQNYLGDSGDKENFRASPLLGDLSGLPPAVIVTAEFDPLRDQGAAYAKALEEAGVDVTYHCFDGMIHGFFDLWPLSEACADAVKKTCGSLKDALAADRQRA